MPAHRLKVLAGPAPALGKMKSFGRSCPSPWKNDLSWMRKKVANVDIKSFNHIFEKLQTAISDKKVLVAVRARSSWSSSSRTPAATGLKHMDIAPAAAGLQHMDIVVVATRRPRLQHLPWSPRSPYMDVAKNFTGRSKILLWL